MQLYNKLLREHQVLFLLFNIFETAIRSKLAYLLSLKYSNQNQDDWLHVEALTPNNIKVIIQKVKEYIAHDGGDFAKMSTYEIFDYITLDNLKSIYYSFWGDVGYLFNAKEYKGHRLKEIGRARFKDMLEEIRKARNDIAHHKPLHKRRKRRYKLIEDIEYILLHLGFNLEDAINSIDPKHEIIKVGYYDKTRKIKQLMKNPSKKNLKEIEKLCQYRGVEAFFRGELGKGEFVGWIEIIEGKIDNE